MLDNALVFSTPTGALALSFDDGDTIIDPRGRRVEPSEVWDEVEELKAVDALPRMTAPARAAVEALLDGARQEQSRVDLIRAKLQRVANGDEQRAKYGRERFVHAGPTGLAAQFLKRGGSRQYACPCSVEQAFDLIEGRARLVYWTNSDRCAIEPVRA
jgi:hypothetical protein